MPTIRPRPRLACVRVALASLAAASGLFALCASPGAAQAPSTYYVDAASANGPCSDSYTGIQAQSPQTPWCTIGKAVASVPPSSTIDVAPAIYHEEVTLTPRDDGVTLQGTGASRPVIEGDWSRAIGIQLVNGVIT